ncbi:MAG: hypothetical protein J2P32_12205, partial [Actinobacteria bacterium]|nr:hypothetical protein [Actinomycetota bacterium]
ALVDSGLVTAEGRGRWQIFDVAPEGVALLARLDRRRSEADPALRGGLDQLAELLETTPVDGPTETVERLRPLLAAVGTQQATTYRWWRELSAGERQSALLEQSVELGDLDGIPARDRHEINLRELKLDEAVLTKQLRMFENGVFVIISLRPRRELTALRAKLTGVRKLIAELEADDSLLLLGYDIRQGTGHATIAVGDPDTAEHVAVFVPGMRYRFAKIDVPLHRAQAMHRAAHEANPEAGPGDIAVIAWGHLEDWPQSIPTAGREAAARRAAPLLHSFLEGLHATHQGRMHLTLVAHSYATVLAGITAATLGLPIDDLVLLASPGTTLDHAERFHLPDGHVWAGTATRDPILTTPRRWHNLLPTHPLFGARIFHAGTGGNYGLIGPHANYWEPDSPALPNVGRIIAGRPDLVTLAPIKPGKPGNGKRTNGHSDNGPHDSGGLVAIGPQEPARQAMLGAAEELHGAGWTLDPGQLPGQPRGPPVTVRLVPAHLRPAGAEGVIAFGWQPGGVVLIFDDVFAEILEHIAAGRLDVEWWNRLLAHERDYHLLRNRHTGHRHDRDADPIAADMLAARVPGLLSQTQAELVAEALRGLWDKGLHDGVVSTARGEMPFGLSVSPGPGRSLLLLPRHVLRDELTALTGDAREAAEITRRVVRFGWENRDGRPMIVMFDVTARELDRFGLLGAALDATDESARETTEWEFDGAGQLHATVRPARQPAYDELLR